MSTADHAELSNRTRTRVLPFFGCFVIFCFLVAPLASYAQTKYLFDLPAQPLAESLRAVGHETGTNVMFEPRLVKGLSAPALRTQATITEAIRLLLSGTQLTALQTAADTILIQDSVSADRSDSARETVSPTSAVARTNDETRLAQGGVEEAAKNSDRAQLEEIVVTAQKRRQTLQEVPFSIQAFDGKALESRHVRDFSEVIASVPGASEGLSNTIGLRQYQIRGISQAFGDPTVGYYFDDAAFFIYGQNYAPAGRTFDMNRVEVLRGPQSTLYGNGAMGGVVRFIPNAPDLHESSVHARAGYSLARGGADGHYFDGAVSIPIVEDKLAVRLVGSYEEVGGYQDMPAAGIDDAADGEIKSFRASVLAKPVERLELKLLYLRNETQQNGSSLLVNLDPPLSTGSVGDFASSDFDLFSGTISYEFDFATLSTASSYIDFGRGLQVGFPFPVPGGLLIQKQDTAAHAFNNETRLVSNGSGPLQWLTGLYYADSSNKGTGSLDPPLVPSSTSTADSESISIFGEVSYALFDGKLIPLVGLRYFKDERATDNLVSPDPPDRATFDSINPRFNLTFKPTPNSLYYLNVAKGFRSGQFNDPVSCQDLHRAQGGLPCENAVDSDELWSYEIGSKQDLADRQVQVEAAIYFQDWKDIQQSLQYDNIGQTYQFGDARLYGIDFGLVFAPAGISGLRFETSGNWNSSTYSNIDPVLTAAAAAGGIKDGDRIPLVPDWTLSASASYQWNFPGGGWEGNALIGYNHIAPQLGRPGAVIGKGDARDLLRARIGVRRGGLGIALFGSNLLNENGAIYVAAAGDSSTFTQDYPRQIGIEVTVDGF